VSDLTPLFPRQKVPGLKLPLAGGGMFDVAAERPAKFTLLGSTAGSVAPSAGRS
jgi:hypothetical protein